MSLVGPRPIVALETERYGSRYALYRKVRPGLTGLWQVSGRNNTTYAQRVQFDEYYVRNWSVWLDLYILGRTVKVILTGEGAY
jgi:lipopolysaccharide/colanic/teichoic acid biosynthesis glycosyltransferase